MTEGDAAEWDVYSTSSSRVIDIFSSKVAIEGSLLPRLRELDWFVSEDTNTISTMPPFLSPSLKALRLTFAYGMGVEDLQDLVSLSLRGLVAGSQIKLDLLDIDTGESDVDLGKGVSELLFYQSNIRSLSMPLKLGTNLEKDLDTLSHLQSIYFGVSDNSQNNSDVIAWLSNLPRRFPGLTKLGLSFDRRATKIPYPPLRQLAPLLASTSLVYAKLGFNPTIDLEDADVLAMAQAWPILKTL